jgi:hypothetical protein
VCGWAARSTDKTPLGKSPAKAALVAPLTVMSSTSDCDVIDIGEIRID